MASTVAGRLLTEQHRRGQLQARSALLRQLIAIWPLFDPERIDETWGAVQPGVMALTTWGREQSVALASEYYQAFRVAEGATGGAAIPPASTAWRAAAAVSLEVTGPVRAKQLVAMGRPDVRAQTLVSLSGAVSRIALNGGRETILEAVRHDRRAVGWARVTTGTPCAFCAMLASRGGVYSKRTVDFRAHDHCACSSEPVFSEGGELPGRGEEYKQLWRESTEGAESGELFTAFRRAYEGRG